MIIYPPVLKPSPPTPKTANYNFTPLDDGACVQFNAAGGLLTGQLLDPNTVLGKVFIAKKIDSSTNDVNVWGTNIEGMASIQLSDQYASITVQAVPNGYIIISSTGP